MSAEDASYREALELPNEGPLAEEQINQAYRQVVWRAFHGSVGYDLCFLALARNRLLEGLARGTDDCSAEDFARQQLPSGAQPSHGVRLRLPRGNPDSLAQRLRRRTHRLAGLHPVRT